MITRPIVAFVSLVLVACATERGMGTGMTWSANIRAMGASGHGGTAAAVPMNGGTHVTVFLTGGSAGGVHPWHVHEGVCDSNGPIVGPAGAYPVLQPDANGNASADVHLAVALDPGGSYYINVHQSASELDTIVGCGELRAGG